MTPVAYVETNFLISLIFEDHERHAPSQALLDNPDVTIKLPYLAAFEARSTLQDNWQTLSNQITRFSAILDNLRRASHLSLGPSSIRRLQSELTRYAQIDFKERLEQILKGDRLQFLHPDQATFQLAEAIFLNSTLSKRDGLDAYILASIMRDTRSLPEDTPRIFMSLNKAEFEPGRKLPKDFYSDYRLVYQSHFNLNAGLEEWRRKFGSVTRRVRQL